MGTVDKHTQPRCLGAAVLLMLCLGLATAATLRAWADIMTLPARNTMTMWEQQGTVSNQQEWRAALAQMQQAHHLEGSNADYVFDLGRLFEWQALTQSQWTLHAHRYRSQAIRYFRTVTTMRPSWGFAWAHLAASKVLNQELDNEAIAALEKALVLGPWEPGTQRKVIWLGTSIWNQLPIELQDKLKLGLRRALRLQPREVIDITIATGWEDHILPFLEQELDRQYLKRRLRQKI